MNPASRSFLSRLERNDPALFGTICGLISCVAYAAANIYLRRAADSDPAWVSCLKALPTALVALFIMASRSRRGLHVWPGRRSAIALFIAGTLAQVGGNIPFQWSLRSVGLALAAPLCTGTLIASAALMGRVMLKEHLSGRTILSMALLIAAVAVLSYSGQHSAHSASDTTVQLALAGALAATGSGFFFATNNVILRRTLSNDVPVSAALFIVSAAGVLFLGLIAVWNVGWVELAATPDDRLFEILLAGTFNCTGFFLLSRALQFLPVAKSNLFIAMQTSISALAGVLLFHEPANLWLGAGLGLAVAGMLLMRRGRAPAEPEEAPEPVPVPVAANPIAHAEQ